MRSYLVFQTLNFIFCVVQMCPMYEDENQEDRNLPITLFLKLKLMLLFYVKSWPDHNTNVNLEFAIIARFNPLTPPHFSTQNHDMCHGTIGAGLVEI